MDEKYWQNFEKLFVHKVYDETTYSSFDEDIDNLDNNICNNTDNNSFSLSHNKKINTNSTDNTTSNNYNSNRYAWKKVKAFLLDLKPYSLVADIGCGDGKYLQLNQNLFTIGCDRSHTAINLANNQVATNQLLICDNLYLPFCTSLFDAVISVGVIHHFSTHKRRVNAIKELCRILKPGGLVMIYVWAMEQKLRKFKSQDVLVPSKKCTKLVRTRHLSQNSLSDDNESSSNDDTTKQLQNQQQDTQPSESINEIVKTEDEIKSITKDFDEIKIENENYLKTLKNYIINKFNSKSVHSSSNNNKGFNLNESIEDINKRLPKEFQIRKFPMSSYENTFEANETFVPQQNAHKQLVKAYSNEHSTSVTSMSINDNGANMSKRFYHVFKSNELDTIINDNFPDMIIYKSYYDHGNWCVCAQKKTV